MACGYAQRQGGKCAGQRRAWPAGMVRSLHSGGRECAGAMLCTRRCAGLDAGVALVLMRPKLSKEK